MVDGQTFRVQSTGTWTRIGALVFDARLVLRTLRAHYTLWTASWRYADESWLTETDSMTIVNAAVAVGSARRRFARVDRQRFWCHFYSRASVERISGEAWQAGAGWSVIDYATSCSVSASVRARIHALVVQTGLAAIAVGIRDTFRSTSCVWITDIFRQASAGSDTVSFVANRIRSAWGWVARCARLFGSSGFCELEN